MVGVDIKMMVPPSGDKWALLLLVDFTSNRLWAWDMDDDKTLGRVSVTFLVVKCGIHVIPRMSNPLPSE